MKIILASSSENRAHLLEKMGFAFEVVHPTYEEKINPHVAPAVQAQTFALEKARSVFPQFASEKDVLLMSFDSMIEFEGESIGKPKTKKDAFEMIQKFAGKSQKVVTGIALTGNIKGKKFEKVSLQSTSVRFRSDITNCQIRKYLEFGDWKGKCGAYSILGTGIFFLEPFTGDFQSIVGVPVQLLGKMIRGVTGKSPFSVFCPLSTFPKTPSSTYPSPLSPQSPSPPEKKAAIHPQV